MSWALWHSSMDMTLISQTGLPTTPCLCSNLQFIRNAVCPMGRPLSSSGTALMGSRTKDNGQLAEQQQLLYRSQSLTHPSQQAALQRHGMHGPPLQQQAAYGRPQSASTGPSGAHDLVKHLQRHSTGQTHPDASHSMPYQLPSQRQPQYSSQDWFRAQTQASQSQPQPQPQASAQSNPWESGEGLYQAALPRKKSSGDMSRHGSGSTDGPLSEYVPPDSVLVSAQHSIYH